MPIQMPDILRSGALVPLALGLCAAMKDSIGRSGAVLFGPRPLLADGAKVNDLCHDGSLFWQRTPAVNVKCRWHEDARTT